ncbi:hypothetical protein BABINDRAFT_165287 [Babjeviella inositovora NRRL Y-12698]|uniref:Protein kinase domain-containing protein n=1 Tax=Babjeviella inositovora NRRL Y-12698 TaxID=984486 RepID=A0A1E3QW02_9ASCO|nr:uncharacterized protein BABINDRAFT_165287 [Babjeviella inositovora NRRL Y-12698]ODQ81764.1 hypothetical protein BABINDRAFT_165287 [Babjeviella inositovora NRRL Y-12698]
MDLLDMSSPSPSQLSHAPVNFLLIESVYEEQSTPDASSQILRKNSIIPIFQEGSIPNNSGGKLITFGRSPKSTFQLTNPAVSLHHCVMWCIQFDESNTQTQPLVYLWDKGSLNGTYVNDKVITKGQIVLLEDNDVVEIERGTKFVFSSWVAPAMTRPLLPQNHQKEPTIPNWEVSKRVLGTGAFGSVYLAKRLKNTDKNKDKFLYAVKVIPVRTETAKIPALLLEAQILSKLDHPNVIRVHEAVTRNGNFYIFQDLICGGDLFSYLVQGDSLVPLPESECLVITYQILLALKYLQDNNIAHRDLKLDNILLATPEPCTRVVLADFGIARYTSPPAGLLSLTTRPQRMHTIVGTPEYSAPEVGFLGRFRSSELDELETSTNSEGYDFRCDMWSVGVIVHIILSGISPFYENGDELRMVQSASVGELKYLLQNSPKHWGSVSEDAKAFVRKLLRVNPEERHTCASGMGLQWVSGHEKLLRYIYHEVILKRFP